MPRGAGRPSGHSGSQGQRSAGLAGPGSSGPGGPDGPHEPHGTIAYGKAMVIVVVAVVLGAYLLSLGNSHGGATPPAATTTTTTAPGGTTTTSTTAPPAAAKPSKSVTVLVANASHTTGIAGYYTNQLASDGWATLTATTALTVETTSTVYYASGQQADAATVASELQLPSSSVQALGGSIPVSSTTGADVIVVAGVDLAGKVPATTTTTAG